MRKSFCTLVSLCGLFASAISSEGQPPMNEAEQAELRQILDPLDAAMKSAQQSASDRIARYVKDLEELEKKMVARGDLDAVVKARAEREAWAAGNRALAPDASVKMPPECNSLRRFLDSDIASIDARAESAIKRETARAVSGLKAFEVRLTRAARIEAALAVRETTAKIEKGICRKGARRAMCPARRVPEVRRWLLRRHRSSRRRTTSRS